MYITYSGFSFTLYIAYREPSVKTLRLSHVSPYTYYIFTRLNKNKELTASQ